MNSIDSKLTSDERILYRTKCHWAMFLGPILIIIIGGLALKAQGIHAAALMAFGILWYIISFFSFRASDLAVTQKRVLINAGFPRPRSYEIQLNEIVAVDYYQPTLGSMLNFGKLIITDKKQGRCVIRFIASPAQFVTEVREQISSLKSSQ